MKYIFLLLVPISLFATPGATPAPADNAPLLVHNTPQLSLTPDATVLYYNQDYHFELSGAPLLLITKVEMDGGRCFQKQNTGFDLNVSWSNRDEHEVTLKVSAVDTAGNVVVVERKLSLVQKLPSPYQNYDLLKAGNKLLDTRLSITREDLMRAEELSFNTGSFTHKNVALRSFKLRIGDRVYESADGTFTPDMKAAIRKLKLQDVVTLEEVKGVYTVNGVTQPFDLHYSFTYTIDLPG